MLNKPSKAQWGLCIKELTERRVSLLRLAILSAVRRKLREILLAIASGSD